jgi:hypothetical protein
MMKRTSLYLEHSDDGYVRLVTTWWAGATAEPVREVYPRLTAEEAFDVIEAHLAPFLAVQLPLF